jgi:hypothetical protein
MNPLTVDPGSMKWRTFAKVLICCGVPSRYGVCADLKIIFLQV